MARGGGRLRPLTFSRQAVRDVRSAARYLDRETGNQRYGDAFVDAVSAACRRLTTNPLLGREHPLFRLRCLPVRSHLLFYHVLKDVDETVEVVRVLHQRRNQDKALKRWIKPR